MCKRNKNKPTVIKASLAKKTDLGPSDTYVNFLLSYQNNKEVKNIGVFGTYGSGKSSVVSSFINETGKKAIYFSQDTFNKYIKESNDSKKTMILDIRNSIYKEILSYTTDSIRSSQYFRVLFAKPSDRFMYAVLFCLFAVVSVFLSFYLYKYFGWLSILIGAASFLSLSLLTYLFSLNKIKKVNVAIGKTVSFVADTETDISEQMKKHPVAIENMLIRILDSNRIKYIVVEDIERLGVGNIVDYIKEFKILNDLINRSKEYEKDPIVFIYGLKDLCVDDSELRTKYFDLIVPIIPYASFSNAEDSILSDAEISNEVSKGAVFDISTYFQNQRQVIALATQYNLNKNKTYSEGLKDELFALSALNVLFPRVYALLFLKNNFMDAILKLDIQNSNLFDEIERALRSQINGLMDKEKLGNKDADSIANHDVILFIKTCLVKKYFTYNYEKLLCSNVKNSLASNDAEVLKKINSLTSIRGLTVNDPKLLISKMHDNVSLLFLHKFFLNVDIAKFVLSSRDSVLTGHLKSLIQKLSLEETIDFTDEFDESSDEGLKEEYIKMLSDHHLIYTAAPKTKENHKNVYLCFKNSNANTVSNHSQELKAFFETINSNIFIEKYGKNVPLEKYKELASTGRLHLHSISAFSDKPLFVEFFKDNNAYEVNGKNLEIIFSDYIHKPVYYLINNGYVWKAVQTATDKMFALALFANVDKTGSKDSATDIYNFFNALQDVQSNLYSTNQYFSQWFFKIPSSLFNGNKNNLRMLERGFINIAESNFVSGHIPAYQPSIEECFKNNANSIKAKIKFDVKDSWTILFNFDRQLVKDISVSLSLSNAIANCPSIDIKKNALTFGELLPVDERKSLIQFLVDNDTNSFFELLNNGDLIFNDLKAIKLSQSIAIKACSEKNIELLNLFTLSHNAEISIQTIKANQKIDFADMFFNKEGSIVECTNLDLYIEYFCSESRNFDKVASLIIELDSSFFLDKQKWHRFLDSFKESESTQWDYYYFLNNDNNKNILDKLSSNGVVSNPIPVKTKNQIKCKILS